MIQTFAALADRILDKPASVTPRFVAIDGPSGAGKSTFALRLARSLGDPPVVECRRAPARLVHVRAGRTRRDSVGARGALSGKGGVYGL